MTFQRNTKGLKAAAQQKNQATRLRAKAAIKKLLSSHQTVNFRTVSQTGNVSIAWLYRQPDLRAQIERYRTMPPTKRPQKPGGGKNGMIASLKQRVKKLEQEKQQLEQTIERLYGENADLLNQLERTHT
jgi:hypothetical protein